MKSDLKVSIPKPCSANWNEMAPHEKGKFCGLCSLTVVDFTNMNTTEIKEYFTIHYGQKTCGRFNITQLHSCNNSEKNFWDKKIEVIERKYKQTFFRTSLLLFLAFISVLSGCRKTLGPTNPHIMGDIEPETMGEPKFEEVDTLKTTTKPIIKDTLDHEIGKIYIEPVK